MWSIKLNALEFWISQFVCSYPFPIRHSKNLLPWMQLHCSNMYWVFEALDWSSRQACWYFCVTIINTHYIWKMLIQIEGCTVAELDNGGFSVWTLHVLRACVGFCRVLVFPLIIKRHAVRLSSDTYRWQATCPGCTMASPQGQLGSVPAPSSSLTGKVV